MAKRLSTKAWIDRAVEKLGSVKAVAEKLGRSPSTISAIRSGKRPGDNLRESARDLAKGKRAPVAPPPVKAPKPKAPPKLSPMQKAEAQLTQMMNSGAVDKVVVYINTGTGRGITLGAKGGIDIHQLWGASSLAAFLQAQAGKQHYTFDVTDLLEIESEGSIEFEEYY